MELFHLLVLLKYHFELPIYNGPTYEKICEEWKISQFESWKDQKDVNFDVLIKMLNEDFGEVIKKADEEGVFEEDKKVFQRSQFATLEIPNRGMTFVNESGLYSLIFGSKLESANRFKLWVTSEVLPSIRKHGAYMTNEVIERTLTDPDYLIQLATALKEKRQARKLAEEKILFFFTVKIDLRLKGIILLIKIFPYHNIIL